MRNLGRARALDVALLSAAVVFTAGGLAPSCADAAAPKPAAQIDDEATMSKRSKMVVEQIEARGVVDPRVLAAMRDVPRHAFVPDTLDADAYRDHPLPIGKGQTISQPYIVAAMSELARLQPGDKALEIGTGSGYGAAILSRLVERVYSIEIIPELAESAKKALASLGYDNVEVIVGDGYRGLPEQAPFDAILVTAAPGHVPQPLLDQLAEGGRLVIPVGSGFQELRVYEKKNGEVEGHTVFPVRFVPMTGEAQKRK